MKLLRNQVRHDAGADPNFAERVKEAFRERYVTAAEAETQLIDTGSKSGAEAARLRMLGRMGLLEKGNDADTARQNMINRREKK